MDIQNYIQEKHPNYSCSDDVLHSDIIQQYIDGQLQDKLQDAVERNDAPIITLYQNDIKFVEGLISKVRQMSNVEIAKLIDADLTIKLLTECEE